MTLVKIGYGTTTMDLAQLGNWPQWQNTDGEFARRLSALVEHSNVAGHPLGIGNTFRTTSGQLALALSRHHEVSIGAPHCCQFRGADGATRYYALNRNANGTFVAHAAFPGESYHEAVPPTLKCFAADMTGDMVWMDGELPKYGLRWVAPERWHVQPVELPAARFLFRANMVPLPTFTLPGEAPAAGPVVVFAPNHWLRPGANTDLQGVRHLQDLCNWWGWRSADGRMLVVDGGYGPKTTQAVAAMQYVLHNATDGAGVYGPATHWVLQAFLNDMTAFAAKAA